MFVDASALTAMLTDESDARELLARLQNASCRITSPLAVWETAIAVARILGLSVHAAHQAVEEFLASPKSPWRRLPPRRARWPSTPMTATASRAIRQH